LAPPAKTGGIPEEEIPGDISAEFYPAYGGRLEDSRERKPARRRTHNYGRFFVETVPKKVQVWYRNTW
jgi:hypothetical protein